MHGAQIKEEWRAVHGYEGAYQVSNLGNVRSLDRLFYQKSSHGGMMMKKYQGVQMIPTDNGHGYMIVSLRINGKRKNHYVHRIVAEAFIDNPNGCDVINHKDYNTRNNAASNLEWTTQKENVLHSVVHMEKPRNKCKQTVTGEKYITKRGGKLRFSIITNKVRFDRTYNTLEEAIAARTVIIGG